MKTEAKCLDCGHVQTGNSVYAVNWYHCERCGSSFDDQAQKIREKERFDDTMRQIRVRNQEMEDTQNGITSSAMAQIMLGHHKEFVLKAFSDTLRERESLTDLEDGHYVYKEIEHALEDAYHRLMEEEV